MRATPDPTILSDRALVRLSGDDPRGFLQGLLTNDVSGALPVWAGLLTAQGKALFDLIVWADGDDLLLDCEADRADALIRRLSLYRLRRALVIERDEALSVHWSPQVSERPFDPRLPALGHRWVAGFDRLSPDGSNGSDASGAWRAHRLRAGVPEGVAELGDGTTLWLEANGDLLHGVRFDKGCYVGQENTARMNWRGKVNRRLMVLPLPLSDEARRRAGYPDLALAVDHRRVSDMTDLPVADWMRPALQSSEDGAG